MTPKEHAEIWRRAAQVVAGMDTITSEMNAYSMAMAILPPGVARQYQNQGYTSRTYSPEEAAANRAYQAAARVLAAIAAEYDKAAEPSDAK